MTPIEIPSQLLAASYAHATAAFPDECCGYLVGPADGTAVDTLIRCQNAQTANGDPAETGRGSDTGYAFAGRELFDFAVSFRTERPARIVYHSHPNGRAYFSALDRTIAMAAAGPAYPVQHLVLGVRPGAVTQVAQFGWDPRARDYVELARWTP
ncbi:MAG: Mov34/MPN/PAD-1 family protein [Kofleriaceae bacterium]